MSRHDFIDEAAVDAYNAILHALGLAEERVRAAREADIAYWTKHGTLKREAIK